jgi:hypothetical protein
MWTLFPKQALVQADTNAVKVGYGAIFNRQAIRATLPIAFFGQGGFIALQTLWAAPWLIQVLAQTKEQAASSLFIMNSTLVCIYIVIGTFASKLSLKTERLAILASLSISSFALLLMTIWQAPLSWILLPVMAAASTGTMMVQARVSVSMPKAISGRGNVALNLVIFVGGFVLQGGIGWAARTASSLAGLSDTQGLAVTFGVLAICQLASIFWLWSNWRETVNFDES